MAETGWHPSHGAVHIEPLGIVAGFDYARGSGSECLVVFRLEDGVYTQLWEAHGVRAADAWGLLHRLSDTITLPEEALPPMPRPLETSDAE